MQFDWRNQTGELGEIIMNRFVISDLKFIYRRVDRLDVGIDGEIETTDNENKVTGSFLKVQVKAKCISLKGTDSFKVSMSKYHMDYLKYLNVQPILAAVSIDDGLIWWKAIAHGGLYEDSEKGSTVHFNTKDDLLTEKSIPILKLLAESSNAIIAGSLIDDVTLELQKIYAQHDADIIVPDDWAQTLAMSQDALRDAQCLLKFERRISPEIDNIRSKLFDAIYDVNKAWRWIVDYNRSDLYRDWARKDDMWDNPVN